MKIQTNIRFFDWTIRNKLDKLKNIYNIKTDTKLVEHLINLHLQKHGFSTRELTIDEVLKILEISKKDLDKFILSYKNLILDKNKPKRWLITLKELMIKDLLEENLNIDTEDIEVQEALEFLDDFYLETEIKKINKI